MKSLLKRKFFLILKRFSGLLVFRKSRIKYGFLFVILVIGAVSFPLTSMASPALGDMGVISGGIMDMLINLALGLGEFFIKMSIFFLRFFIALAQYNNYIDSPVVKLGWLMVRDVVNMFFVVIVLVIAI
ncbi:MAG: hypothetical protein HZC26_01250, partial [Candidatus Magasanikbacteria bacterium]|nr:hypothetical protein [Candidatus Magasanikbacteria bacterium]